MVFIGAFCRFAAPMVVGLTNFIAPLAYMDIQQFTDRHLFKMGTWWALSCADFRRIAADSQEIHIPKDYTTLSYKAVERKPLLGGKQAWAHVFLILLLLISYTPYWGRSCVLRPELVDVAAPPLGRWLTTRRFCSIAGISSIRSNSAYWLSMCILIGLPVAG